MPKRACGRKKGIQRSPPRHHLGSRETSQYTATKDSGFLCISQSQYLSLGTKCFNILTACCEKFHLIGVIRTDKGEYVPLCGKAQYVHYTAVVLCLALCVQKTWATVNVFLYQELGIGSFMCLGVALVYVVPVLLGLPIVLRPKETMDLLNSWSHVSDSVKRIDPHSDFHPLGNRSACLKTVSGTLVTQGIAFTVALLSLIMSDLPIFLFPMTKRLELFPQGFLPNWAWQIMAVLLEWLAVLPFMLIGASSANFLYMQNGALDLYLQHLGGVIVRSVKSRRRVEQSYVQLELFSRIAQVWIRFFFPAWLFGLSLGVIIAIFVTIRYTELPLYFYIMFPYIGSTLLVLIFWQSYDMLRVTRASEDILGKLLQHEAPYFQRMTRADRVNVMKRSRAMRPVIFFVAGSEFSLSLPINTWDEILNQIVFLLSL